MALQQLAVLFLDQVVSGHEARRPLFDRERQTQGDLLSARLESADVAARVPAQAQLQSKLLLGEALPLSVRRKLHSDAEGSVLELSSQGASGSILGSARFPPVSHTGPMDQPDWHLQAWLKHFRKKQAALTNELNWSPNRRNKLFHGRQSYRREDVNEVAAWLGIEPFELLMPPDLAIALRRLRQTAVQIAAEAGVPFDPQSPRDEGSS